MSGLQPSSSGTTTVGLRLAGGNWMNVLVQVFLMLLEILILEPSQSEPLEPIPVLETAPPLQRPVCGLTEPLGRGIIHWPLMGRMIMSAWLIVCLLLEIRIQYLRGSR